MKVRCFPGGPFQENGYLVLSERGPATVAVDPGGGAGEMVRFLEEEGRALTAIVLTHAHLDHVDGVPAVRAFAPDAPIHLHPADRLLYDAVPDQARMFGLPAPALPAPDVEIVPGADLALASDLRFQVRFAPGHAPGHVILVADAEGWALVGDVVFQGSIGRTDLPGGDFQTLMRSIREQVLTLPDEMRLLPGHGPETSVGRERRTNPFLTGTYAG
ncbi:MAG: MBL fold metallo-hydrolase [Longimicrobiales bacterium]|nr:MBL fold metallo-hydrolase [Longimicrobiales bacterium]